MRYFLDGSQAALVDKYTINDIGIPSMVLMERAALECVKVINPEAYERIICVCGCGNNGGDGVAIARILCSMGFDAEVYIIGKPESMTVDMKNQVSIAKKSGVVFKETIDFDDYDTVVDAIFGIGLSREITGDYKTLIEEINESNCNIFAVDTPSGINSKTGKVMGAAVLADKTVTFGYAKTGLMLYPGCLFTGELTVADIGFATDALDKLPEEPIINIEKSDADLFMSLRSPSGNKGTFGKALIIAGSVNMCGAAVFCAKAAYRAGAGLVKIITPSENRIIIQTSVPEAIIETYDNSISDDMLYDALRWADVVAMGPGIGVNAVSKDFVHKVLSMYDGKLVIDADGLNCVKEDTSVLKTFKGELVITPHVGEMARLTGLSATEIKDDLINTCRSFAKVNNLTCVLKDARTVICKADGETYINTTGNSGMATGGSGDVLTGMITGILSQDIMPDIAVPIAVYLHGAAGDKASSVRGAHSVIASDIIDYI